MKFVCYIWATWFGSGFFPVAPGTAGSIAALPFVWFFARMGFLPLFIFTLFAFITGVAVSNYISGKTVSDDPQIVVIDEVCGMGLTFFLVPVEVLDPFSWKGWVIALIATVLFRIFDVWKPWPASFFDKKMHNGWGMMLDDVAAGVYSMAALFIIYLSFFVE